MRSLLLTLVVGLLTLVPSLALANPAMDGTWRVAVMKKGSEKTSLAKKDYTLVLTFNHSEKTWSARALAPGKQGKKGDDGEAKKERKREGTYRVEGEKVILESGKEKHELRVLVKGNQMILSPVDEPNVRLVALKVS